MGLDSTVNEELDVCAVVHFQPLIDLNGNRKKRECWKDEKRNTSISVKLIMVGAGVGQMCL